MTHPNALFRSQSHAVACSLFVANVHTDMRAQCGRRHPIYQVRSAAEKKAAVDAEQDAKIAAEQERLRKEIELEAAAAAIADEERKAAEAKAAEDAKVSAAKAEEERKAVEARAAKDAKVAAAKSEEVRKAAEAKAAEDAKVDAAKAEAVRVAAEEKAKKEAAAAESDAYAAAAESGNNNEAAVKAAVAKALSAATTEGADAVAAATAASGGGGTDEGRTSPETDLLETLIQSEGSVYQQIGSMVNGADVRMIAAVQQQMLDRFEKTNAKLDSFNLVSASKLDELMLKYQAHTNLLVEAKKDLHSVFRRIRILKETLSKEHPVAFEAVKKPWIVPDSDED